jgi:hypothetical protein
MIGTLEALIRRMSRIAEDQFDDQSFVDLTWLADTPTGQERIVSPAVGAEENKNEIMNAIAQCIRQFFKEHDVFRYVCASEAWVRGEDWHNNPDDREEKVVIVAVDHSQRLAAFREIIRPANRKPYLGKLGPIMKQPLASPEEDRFSNLLPQHANHLH